MVNKLKIKYKPKKYLKIVDPKNEEEIKELE